MDHATHHALQECDYWREAESTRRFKLMLAKYPEFAVPAVGLMMLHPYPYLYPYPHPSPYPYPFPYPYPYPYP